MVHNPNTRETEAEDHEFKFSFGYIVKDPVSSQTQNKWNQLEERDLTAI